jgi:hypothetical protein
MKGLPITNTRQGGYVLFRRVGFVIPPSHTLRICNLAKPCLMQAGVS